MKPSITFPRSKSFRDLTSSHFDPVDNATNQLGTFKCGACAYCDNLDTQSSAKLPGGTVAHYVDCSTRGIVYLTVRAGPFMWASLDGDSTAEFTTTSMRHL